MALTACAVSSILYVVQSLAEVLAREQLERKDEKSKPDVIGNMPCPFEHWLSCRVCSDSRITFGTAFCLLREGLHSSMQRYIGTMNECQNAMRLKSRAIYLPSSLQRILNEAAADYLRGDAGRRTNFSLPAGEPALSDPDSVSWKIFKNPISLFIGGVAAVILELAEPRVCAGVWEHSGFRNNPLERLRNTGLAAMVTVYAPASQAQAMIASIVRRHERVAGVTPHGMPYRANDPELLNWVYATASFGFLQAYQQYVTPLTQAERDRFYGEGITPAGLYGACGAPATEHELDLLFTAMSVSLQPSPALGEFLAIMTGTPLLPGPIASIQGLLVRAAVNLVPPLIQKRLGLAETWELRPWHRAVIRRIGALADRVVLGAGPSAQACRRLGLPEDYLYRSRPDGAE
jgi:uncharacterized protein (DUF2236 family)